LRKAQGAASAYIASRDLYCTPSTATLASAWLTDLYTSLAGGVREQCASRYSDNNGICNVFNSESDFVIGHAMIHRGKAKFRLAICFASTYNL